MRSDECASLSEEFPPSDRLLERMRGLGVRAAECLLTQWHSWLPVHIFFTNCDILSGLPRPDILSSLGSAIKTATLDCADLESLESYCLSTSGP